MHKKKYFSDSISLFYKNQFNYYFYRNYLCHSAKPIINIISVKRKDAMFHMTSFHLHFVNTSVSV